MEPFLIEEASNITGARIVAVGVGGGGGNMIGHMIKEGVTGIEMIMVNTDAQRVSGGASNYRTFYTTFPIHPGPEEIIPARQSLRQRAKQTELYRF